MTWDENPISIQLDDWSDIKGGSSSHLEATILTCPVKICDTLRSGQCAISKMPCKAWDIIIQETKTNF